MSNIGWSEILISIGVIALLILIPKKLPQLARSLGRSIRSFKRGLKAGKKEVRSTVDQVNEAAGVEELRSTVSEIREAADVKDVLPDEKPESGSTTSEEASGDSGK